MSIYIALLRGINVSGHNKIKMAELRKVLEEAGLTDVQTYIQSGNILFRSELSADVLRERIEGIIHTAFGLTITVVLRTAEEWERIIAECPYAEVPLGEVDSIHLTCLTEEAAPKAVSLLANCDREDDEYTVCGREIYFLFRRRIVDSKLAAAMQKLGKISTTRNWNTVRKLSEMARALQEKG
ncbi:DUF1697 domain-containing protein [Paenibacillus aurantius]|uniref:DUF1697 domain-containing protein n=1 Tax=Paenibacillus aurantius TaxID=2918900 RepID=A0AA96RCV1_9BACL|nr:DUF1697 domain-containing protein [Paenibacillus aurantius]WNQ10900.1 DUF1697 domain-containing protein [Paenibacillus aurantius]